ncbi:MAG: hypothetical protein F6K56_18775 [Moorea sp. SIO3G5]|nr:hypothetical protein [Moorena sp. SIO3G5]
MLKFQLKKLRKLTVQAMQRGLGGFPHEQLHQDRKIMLFNVSIQPSAVSRQPSAVSF